MKQAVSIRSERPEDAPEVGRLLKAAFAGDPHSDGRESELVEALRRSDDYLPRLALTAENEAGVAGFLMMTRGFVPGEGGEARPPGPGRPAGEAGAGPKRRQKGGGPRRNLRRFHFL